MREAAAQGWRTDFNNAGIEPRKSAPTAEYEEEEWNRIIDINLRGVFLCMKHEIPLILKQGDPAVDLSLNDDGQVEMIPEVLKNHL